MKSNKTKADFIDDLQSLSWYELNQMCIAMCMDYMKINPNSWKKHIDKVPKYKAIIHLLDQKKRGL